MVVTTAAVSIAATIVAGRVLEDESSVLGAVPPQQGMALAFMHLQLHEGAPGPTDMQVYRIMRDVTGEAYTLLLEAALKEASTFSLVWRDQLQFGPSAAAVREALRGLQLRHVKRDRWPGTILVGHYASVVTYRAAPEALPALLEPGSLFAWQSPAYPEDLSFSTEPGAVCLATVSHEAKAWILSPSLAAAIGKRVTLTRETLDARDEQYFNAV